MMLKDKRVIVHGAGGSLGAGLSRTFGREGARVFLAGHGRAALESVADSMPRGAERVDVVDARDAAAVDAHVAMIAATAGGIDVCVNATSIDDVQGTALVDLSLDSFLAPVVAGATTHFLTSRAAARVMAGAGSGTILTISATPARLPGPDMGGFGVACAAIEALSRNLAGELGRHGIRVVCLRPDKIVDAPPGLLPREFEDSLIDRTLLGRLPTVAEVAEVAAFVASDRASSMTGTVANLSCGSLTD